MKIKNNAKKDLVEQSDHESQSDENEEDDDDEHSETGKNHHKKFNEYCSIYKFNKQIHLINKQLLYSDTSLITSRLNDRITSLLENILSNILNIILISTNHETLENIKSNYHQHHHQNNNYNDNNFNWIEYCRWFDGAGIQYCLNSFDTISHKNSNGGGNSDNVNNNNENNINNNDGNGNNINTQIYCQNILNFIFKKHYSDALQENHNNNNEFINFIEIFIERMIREYET